MRHAAGIVAALLALGAGAANAQGEPARDPVPLTTPEPAPEAGAVPQGQGSTGPALVVPSPPNAAAPQIMTIDPEQVFARTRWGQRVHADIEQRGREIAAENDRLADQFSAEEQQLTSLRATLNDEEFRKRADEFDKRVVEVRRARDGVARELDEQIEKERAAFFRAALPVLAQLMQERGATVVLDQRAIFVSAQSADVTDDLIKRMDETIGAGPDPAAPADQEPPAQPAP